MTDAIIKPKMSNDDYHAHKAVSRSMLCELEKSPKKYWYKYLSGEHEEESTDALKIGSAFHTLVLEPEKFAEVAVIVPDDKRRPTKAQINAKKPSDSTVLLIEWWEKFDAEYGDKAQLKEKEVEQIKAMARSLRETPEAQKLLAKKGMIEPSIFWTDEDTGVNVKTKPDFIWQDKSVAVDLKSVANADKDSFEKSVGDYGYDLQAYMAMEAIRRLNGKAPDIFVFACVEKKPPYETAFYVASEDVLKAGEVKYRYLLNKLKHCRVNDTWPSKVRGLKQIGVKPWQQTKINEMQEEIENNE